LELLKGNILSTVVKLAVPMIWGMFSIVAFNLADTYFIGQLGATELAAVSFTFPVIMFFGSIAIGLSMGLTSVISKAFGQKDYHLVKRLGSDSIVLSLLIVIVFSTLGYFLIDQTFDLMGADALLRPIIKEYMEVWYLGMVFLVVPMVSNGAIRGSGDTVVPAVIMTVAAGANIILDPIFIFGGFGIPAMGVKGAAIATVIARGITLFASLYFLLFRLKILSFEIPSWKEFYFSARSVLRIGIPTAGSNIIIPISLGFITAILAQFGNDAVAAFGVVSRLESFAMLVMIGFSTALSPFVGQNFGANQMDRVKTAFKLGMAFSISWGLLTAIIFFFMNKTLIRIFNTSPGIVQYASIYMLFVPFSYGLEGIRLIATNIYNSLGAPIPPTLMAGLRMVVLYVPLAYLGAQYWGVKGVFAAQFIGNSIVGLVAVFFLSRFIERLQEKPEQTH